MMAEQKFYDAQRLIEVQLSAQTHARSELLLLYFETLKSQQKKILPEFLLELAIIEADKKNHNFVRELISEMPRYFRELHFVEIQKLKIEASLGNGQMDEIKKLISDFLIHQYAFRNPTIPVWMNGLIDRFLNHEFSIRLQRLALCLLRKDFIQAEALTKDLILSSIEKASPKGIQDKLSAIADVLKSNTQKSQLEIYQNYCLIASQGINEKVDYKKISEMVIFFEDFRFQVLTLQLLHQNSLVAEAKGYAASIRQNPNYDFVYFDKYFSQLKPYFIQMPKAQELVSEKFESPDLTLESSDSAPDSTRPNVFDSNEDDSNLIYLLKHQNYSTDQLCDLAISFLQSEMPKVALSASEIAIERSVNDQEFLKGCYLKLTSLLQLNDLRAALDTCMMALSKSKSVDDILSFLYGQAEVFIRMKEIKRAKETLSRIVSIDEKYRLAKERLEKLNEI